MSIPDTPDHSTSGDSQPQSITGCSACGAFAYPGDRFCACCGTSLLQNCPDCGAGLSHPRPNYCTSCGISLAGNPEKEG